LTGTHSVDLALSDVDQQIATVTVKSPCQKLWLSGLFACSGEGVAHIILTVTDDGSPRLTSYRRVILQVKPAVDPTKPQ
jgi:beta-lactamase regulating signal transducer with metallopeptidase domain